MAAKARGREGKGGISPRALAASESGEAPGPGAERAAWSGDLKVAGSRPPTGAVLPRGRARFEELLRCPLCGKLVRRHSAYSHALAHLEKLERAGVAQLSRENGGWVIKHGDSKYFGVGWRTLCALAEKLGEESGARYFRNEVRACPETRWARWGRRGLADPGFGWARAQRAGVNWRGSWRWERLGERGGRHFHISSDRVAALIAPYPIEGAEECIDSRWLKVIEEILTFYRSVSVPAVCIEVPRDFRRSPEGALLHMRNGELWLANDGWPIEDIWKAARAPCQAEAACNLEYVIDAMRRERTHLLYVKVAPHPHDGEVKVFYFQTRSLTIIVAAKA